MPTGPRPIAGTQEVTALSCRQVPEPGGIFLEFPSRSLGVTFGGLVRSQSWGSPTALPAAREQCPQAGN